MKLKTLLALVILLPTFVSAETVEYYDLVERNGLYYKKFSDVPFTGKTNGQFQQTFKDGKRQGYQETYYKNGQLNSKTNWKDGTKHGLSVEYYENGQLMMTSNWKDGEKHGPSYVYYHHMRLARKETFKGGMKHGPFEVYEASRHLIERGTYKDGELISRTCFTISGDFTRTGEERVCD
tara:strand:+ start:108 stop:644 length:537 start_codon:yes stop_codon:yes gene_type:complete